MSALRGEPPWALELRLRDLKRFETVPTPDWYTAGDGPILETLPVTAQPLRTWAVPAEPSADMTRSAALLAQHEAELVFHQQRQRLEKDGVVFCDLGTAIVEHQDLVRPYLGKHGRSGDGRLSALNGSVWSGGAFVYVPPNVTVEVPLQSYARVRSESPDQFERTLIVAGDGATIQYLEGCSAPVYTSDAVRCSAVEIVVGRGAKVSYTTIQNWSSNVTSVADVDAVVEQDGHLKIIGGNIGGRRTMHRPSVVLNGRGAAADVLAMTYAGRGQVQHVGAEVISAAEETSTRIVSRAIVTTGGEVEHQRHGRTSRAPVGGVENKDLAVLLLDSGALADKPSDEEPSVTTVTDQQLFYLMSRGVSKGLAIAMLVNGFIEPVTGVLPTEYAVEWSRLVELQLQETIG